MFQGCPFFVCENVICIIWLEYIMYCELESSEIPKTMVWKRHHTKPAGSSLEAVWLKLQGMAEIFNMSSSLQD